MFPLVTEYRVKIFDYQMSSFLDKIFSQARRSPQKIVLPESGSARILDAARIAAREGIAEVILITDRPDTRIRRDLLPLDNLPVRLINCLTSSRREKYADDLFTLREKKGISRDDAGRLIRDPIYFGMMMLKNGDVDGLIAGAVYSTADTIRPALQIIKTAEGIQTVSSMFFIVSNGRTYLFADCGLNRNPDPEELAEITLSTARTARLFGISPRIALLSYSTHGSGKGGEVEKMRKATERARRRLISEFRGEFMIDGELQFDAAFVPEVAEIKCPESSLRGRANVFIFPNLDASNIAYKLAHRLAGAAAYGPILQGLERPVNDLSRGCSAADIVAAIAITVVQAQSA